jgi:YaiO family outer membrane protein
MSAARLFGLCLCLCVGAPLAGAAGNELQVEAGAGIEHLSNGSPDWRQIDVAVRRPFGAALAELAGRQAERYGATDHELAVGLSGAIDDNWSGSGRATSAGNASFLPREGVALDLSRRLGLGWVADAGLTRNLYHPASAQPSGTTLARVGTQWYVGNWRVAGEVNRGRLDGGTTANGWRLETDRYFGDRGARVGLIVAGGRELEVDTAGVISTRVDSIVLLARWPVARRWSVSLAGGRTRISDIQRLGPVGAQSMPGGYHRDGVRLGVQLDF